MVREQHPAVAISPKRWCGGRGTGAVMATGFYEGSLSTEGTLGHSKNRLSRGGSGGGLGGSFVTPTRARDREEARADSPRRRANGETRRRGDKGVRGSIVSGTVGRQRPRSCRPQGREAKWHEATSVKRSRVFETIRRSERGRRENVHVPRSCHAEPKTPWGVHAAKAAVASWECARCGCTQVVRVAEVGWTHRASSAPGGRKASWRNTEGASQKEAREHRLTRGTGGEKAKRYAGSRPLPGSRDLGLRVSACRFSIRRKAFSDYRLQDPHGNGSTGSFDPEVKPRGRRSERKASHEQRIERIRNPTRACLRVTAGTSEVDAVW